VWLGSVTLTCRTCNPEVAGLTPNRGTTLGKLFIHVPMFTKVSSTNWYRFHCREGYGSMRMSGPPPIYSIRQGRVHLYRVADNTDTDTAGEASAAHCRLGTIGN